MKNKILNAGLGLLACVSMALPASAAADESGFEIRLSYLPALQDIGDWYEEHLERDTGGWDSVDAEVFVIPVGLSMAYRWDMPQLTEGAFAWADLGPAAVMIGDASFWMIPVGGGVGYELGRSSDVSAYGKAGLRYPFAGGDAFEESSPGLLLAGGIEFGKSDSMMWFAEAALDGSTVEFADSAGREEIELGLILSIGAKFK